MTETAGTPPTDLRAYIETVSTVLAPAPEVYAEAREESAEFELPVPDHTTGRLIATLATGGSRTEAGAIVASPAASLVALYVLEGLAPNTAVTCIDPEAEHTQRARATLKKAGYPASRGRFLTARPLDVLGRMAPEAYQLIFADVAPVEARAFIAAAVPLLVPGGSVVLADTLLDATIADPSRTDRSTAAARETVNYLAELQRHPKNNVLITHLPLGAGMTIITRKAHAR